MALDSRFLVFYHGLKSSDSLGIFQALRAKLRLPKISNFMDWAARRFSASPVCSQPLMDYPDPMSKSFPLLRFKAPGLLHHPFPLPFSCAPPWDQTQPLTCQSSVPPDNQLCVCRGTDSRHLGLEASVFSRRSTQPCRYRGGQKQQGNGYSHAPVEPSCQSRWQASLA